MSLDDITGHGGVGMQPAVPLRVRKTYLVKVNWTYGSFDFELSSRSEVEATVDEIFEMDRFHSIDDDDQEIVVPIYQINFIKIIPPGEEEVEAGLSVQAVGQCAECEEDV